MNKITVRDQAEFDALPEVFGEPTVVNIRGRGVITILRNPGNSIVIARGDSVVNTGPEARVIPTLRRVRLSNIDNQSDKITQSILPSPEDVLANPETAPVPEDPALQYAAAIFLAGKMDLLSAPLLFRYGMRLSDEASLAMLAFGYLHVNPAEDTEIMSFLQGLDGFNDLSKRHADIILYS